MGTRETTTLKLLFCGDPHFRTKGSVYRQDDYYKVQFNKLEQILELGVQQNVEGVVLLGDLFHSPRESHELVKDVMATLKKYKVPIYGIVGNHDIQGYNHSSLKTSPLGVLAESGLITLLTEGTKFSDNVVLRGVDFQPDHAVDRYVFSQEYDHQLKIVAAHTMIAPFDKAPFDFLHPDQVKTNAQLFFMGHLHSPYDYISNAQIQKPRFVNPGIFMRWTVNEASITPKVALLNVSYVEGIHSYNIQYFHLDAKPGYEVLNLDKAREVKEHTHCIESFIDTLESTTFGGTNLEESITQYSKDQGIDTQIVTELLKRVKNQRGSYGIN